MRATVEGMYSDNALQQLEELEPVPKPPPGPTYEHILGNQIRWTVKMIRYSRYRHRKEKLERLVARQQAGACDASHKPR
jgi:hypothetical protein